DIPQRQFQSAECFDQSSIVRIQQGADFGKASAATVIDICWINTDQPRRKLVNHYISLFDRSDFSPTNDSRIGLNFDDTLSRSEIHTRRPPIPGDERKVYLMNQNVRNLH